MQANQETFDRLPLDNDTVAKRLEAIAAQLDTREGNLYRVRAYRNAAWTVRTLTRPLSTLLAEGGRSSLEELPGIGPRISQVIEQLTLTGHSPSLEFLLGGAEAGLASVVGIGPGLARMIHDRLGITTLEELERAAYDGRLAQLPGFGTKRLRGIREALAGRFRHAVGGPIAEAPRIEDILAIDEIYRKKVSEGKLRHVAPRRFNPTGAAWLPVLGKVRRNGYWFRAMFSNTEVAHRLGKVRDWVVIHYGKEKATGQCTVITAPNGPLAGRRVVRGREIECARYYDQQQPLRFDVAA